MKKLITLFSLFAFVSIGLQAQILFSENFENGIVPDGWTIQSSATDGGWKVGTTGSLSSQSFGIASNGSSRIAATNDDLCNCNKSNEYFITPPLDLSNETAVVLKFDAFYNDNSYQGAQENATIEVSTDSLNWEVVEDLHGHGSWDRHTVNLTDYAGADKLYIGFRYDDGGGWLYGFAIDNITVEVPPLLDVELAELNNRLYGEIGNDIPISGTVFNAGASIITSLEINYTVNGGTPVSETIDNLNIAPFTYHHIELTNSWIPDTEGDYTIEATIVSVNGQMDSNQDNNSGSFDTQIYAPVSVPNKMQEFLETHPDITIVSGASGWLNSPTDLDFFPILGKDELWVVNQRTETQGGSTLTIADATQETPSDFLHRVDGNAWHFMSLPTGIVFSPDNYNFGTSPGVKDANHGGGTFTGPTLWSSDPEVYAQPSGGRQAMPIFNMAWHSNEFFWDGRAHLLRDQSLLPIQDPLEMNETLDNVVAKLSAEKTYRDQFTRAFGSDEITPEKMSLAMEQFMMSIVSYDSKYDRYLAGLVELTESEARGLVLFETEYNPFFPDMSGADCAHCHGGANFENDQYMNNGLDTDATMEDMGREKATEDPADRGKFKVPSLRNIVVTPPYMHDGRFQTLEEVIDHYNEGIQESSTADPTVLNTKDTGLFLTDQDKEDLINFLKTLTDDTFLNNEAYKTPF